MHLATFTTCVCAYISGAIMASSSHAAFHLEALRRQRLLDRAAAARKKLQEKVRTHSGIHTRAHQNGLPTKYIYPVSALCLYTACM